VRIVSAHAGRYRPPKPVCSPPVQLGKKYVTVGTKRISLEQLRKVLGLESVKDATGKIIQEAPLQIWANLRQRALDTAIAQINKKTDLNIAIESLERSRFGSFRTMTAAL
jgi:hypothetical protein